MMSPWALAATDRCPYFVKLNKEVWIRCSRRVSSYHCFADSETLGCDPTYSENFGVSEMRCGDHKVVTSVGGLVR